jgi:HD superfamily phosphodiesterase
MNDINKDIKEYVLSLFQKDLPTHIIYHNFSHTLRVVKKIKELITGEGINEHDALLLETAAWFHDSGFIKGAKKS